MNKVLFVAPTKYNYPLNEDLKSKFVTLSEICKPFIFAFSDKKKTTTLGNTDFIFHKKLENRLLNYLKIIYLFAFSVPKIVKQHHIDIICLQDPVTSYFAIKSLKLRNFCSLFEFKLIMFLESVFMFYCYLSLCNIYLYNTFVAF